MLKQFYFKPFNLVQIRSLNAKQSHLKQHSLILFDLLIGPGSDSNEGVLRIPQSSSIIGTSPLDCLVSYQDTRWWGSTPLQRSSLCILQPLWCEISKEQLIISILCNQLLIKMYQYCCVTQNYAKAEHSMRDRPNYLPLFLFQSWKFIGMLRSEEVDGWLVGSYQPLKVIKCQILFIHL